MTPRWPLTGILALVAAVALCACTADESSPAGPDTPKEGQGTAVLTIDGHEHKIPVSCTSTGDIRQAAGTRDTDSVTLTVSGPHQSVVLVQRDDAGTAVTQALAGLRDDQGNSVGALTVSAEGARYSGRGTFVVTRVGKDGKRVIDPATKPVEGTFTLDCAKGFARPAGTAGPPTAPVGTAPTR